MRTMLFSLIPLRYEVFYGYFRLYPLNPYALEETLKEADNGAHKGS